MRANPLNIASWGAILLGVMACSPALAWREPEPRENARSASDWPLETLKLKDGRTLKGLLQAKNDDLVEFIEIVRPQGKPMFAVLHPLPHKQIESLKVLSAAEHAKLVSRFEQFRHRAMIEAGRMQDLTILEESREGHLVRIYHGPWFTLVSTADEETTRRCIVRIEQTFRAYRLLLPPRVSERRDLQVLLWGTMDEYRGYLGSQRLEIANPAYYSITKNQIVAGSELTPYAAELAKARAQNERSRAEYVSLGDELPKRLQLLTEEMKRKGFSREEIKEEMQSRRAAWAAELQELDKRIGEISRRNDARFAEVTAEMFRRLNHEAFHAYVENYVFPQEEGGLPRWLNEGLAMIFESGQLEADTLRVDAPDKQLLQRLQTDLAGVAPLSLEELLATDARSFVKAHQADASDRNYLYAWGLAYYLTFEHDLLDSERLREYVATSQATDPLVRLEKFVDRPLPKFEAQWRAAMKKLKAPR